MRMNTAFSLVLAGMSVLSSCAPDVIAVNREQAKKMDLENYEQGLKDGTVVEGKIAIDSMAQSSGIVFSDNRMFVLGEMQKREACTVMADNDPQNDSVSVGTKMYFSTMKNGMQVFLSRGRPVVQ